MVKQQQSQSQPQPPQQSLQETKGGGHNVADEQLNEDLIMHCWNGVIQQVESVKAFNKSQGITNSEPYIGHTYDGWSEPMSVKQKRRWLNATKHKKSGKWITVNSLVESGRISDVEKDMFGDQQYPRIELVHMTRVRTKDNSEYLVRVLQAIGLSEIGGVVGIGINGECDFTRKVPVFPDTAKLPDGTDVKILWVWEPAHWLCLFAKHANDNCISLLN